MRIVERVAGYYETQDVEMGTVYRWCPQSVLIECECGETTILTTSGTTCRECGAEHRALAQEDFADHRSEGNEDLHPWCYAKDREGAGIPF